MLLKEHIEKWVLAEKNRKVKKYIHFDLKPDLSLWVKTSITWTTQDPQSFFEEFFDPDKVAKRGFWPFIHFTKETRRFKKNPKSKTKIGWRVKDVGFIPKERPIHFASYFDSYIYSFYNQLVLEKYDSYIDTNWFWESVLAYRHIERVGWKWWKNNIHFAREVFERIHQIQDCHVYAFDITGFFDNLDWDFLYKNVAEILWDPNLSKDWENVLKSVSQFSFIESSDIQKYRLKEKVGDRVRISTQKFQQKRKEISAAGSKLVKKNNEKWIAQWTPISGTLANIYMIEFDKILKEYADSVWGSYYRYSDDILLIIPFETTSITFNKVAKDKVFDEIRKVSLEIQPKKTDIYTFQNWKLVTSFSYDEDIKDFKKDDNLKPLQYLWFLFDGSKVLLRNKTLSIHNYRMHQTIKKCARLLPAWWRKSRVKWIWGIKLRDLNKRFTHLWARWSKKRYWNFYWYMLKANEIMGDFQEKLGTSKNRIKKQMKKYPKNYRKAITILE